MLEIIKIASGNICFWPPAVFIVYPAGPDCGDPRTALIGGGCRTAATSPAAAGAAQNVLYCKILFVDIIALTKQGNLLVIVKMVHIYTVIIILICACACDRPSEISLAFVLFGG